MRRFSWIRKFNGTDRAVDCSNRRTTDIRVYVRERVRVVGCADIPTDAAGEFNHWSAMVYSPPSHSLSLRLPIDYFKYGYVLLYMYVYFNIYIYALFSVCMRVILVSICLYVCLPIIHLSVHVPSFLTTSILPSLCSSVSLSICLHIRLFVRLTVSLSLCLYIAHLPASVTGQMCPQSMALVVGRMRL